MNRTFVLSIFVSTLIVVSTYRSLAEDSKENTPSASIQSESSKVQALEISIAIPRRQIGPKATDALREIVWIGKDSYFFVLVKNISERAVSIFQFDNTWGEKALTFEIKDSQGKVSKATRTMMDYFGRNKTCWCLDPGDTAVYKVNFADEDKWQGFPKPMGAYQRMKMKAVFEVVPNGYNAGVWTGHVESKEAEYIVYR